VRGKEVWDWSLIGCSAPILLMARAVNIFPLSELANSCVRKPSDRISCRMQLVMWWSGLRGAISFALAITLDDTRVDHQVMPAAHAKAIVTTTLAIIIGTNLLMAPATAPLIRAMRLKSAAVSTSLSSLSLPLIEPSTGLGLARSDTSSNNLAASSNPQTVLAGTILAEGTQSSQTDAPQDVTGRRLARSFPGAATNNTSRAGMCATERSISKRKTRREMNPVHRAWRILDQHYMKPLFGGRQERDREDESLNHILGLQSGGRVPPADVSVRGGASGLEASASQQPPLLAERLVSSRSREACSDEEALSESGLEN